MSSKFNPSYNRRKPPPQCKKSEPAIESPSVNARVGSLAGQQMLVDWTWREATENPAWYFSFTGYVQISTFNSFTLILNDAFGYEASITWVWSHVDQTWTASCDVLLNGNPIATTDNKPVAYRGGYPFSIPKTQVNTLRVPPNPQSFLAITVTS